MLDDFLKMLDVKVDMLDSPPGKAKGMLNVLLKMLDKKDLCLNVRQKMLDIVPGMLNHPGTKKMKMLDILAREWMTVEYFFSMLNNKPPMLDR